MLKSFSKLPTDSLPTSSTRTVFPNPSFLTSCINIRALGATLAMLEWRRGTGRKDLRNTLIYLPVHGCHWVVCRYLLQCSIVGRLREGVGRLPGRTLNSLEVVGGDTSYKWRRVSWLRSWAPNWMVALQVYLCIYFDTSYDTFSFLCLDWNVRCASVPLKMATVFGWNVWRKMVQDFTHVSSLNVLTDHSKTVIDTK